jgi:D-glycero-alpha-D-manno-heptose 1-phosphate guanylyltransferase
MTTCAAILAGGLGTRLRSVVADRPKVMALVAGRPFITHLLDQLAEAGIKKTVLCTGYLAGMIRDELGDSFRGMELDYSVEASPLGTGGALRLAAGQLSGEQLLVLNGDSYCECRLAEFGAGHRASEAYAALALAQVPDVSRFGSVVTGAASLVESFREKGGDSGPGWINAGIYLLPMDLVREIPPEREVSLEREIFPDLLARGLYGHHCTGQFIDIGIPMEYQRSQLLFSEKTRGSL